MKTLNLISQISCGVFLSAAVCLASDGGVSGGGGSSFAAEFTRFGNQAVKVIETLPSFPVSVGAFSTVVRSTHIEFVDEVLRDRNGLEVDALNFPKKGLVQVNLNRWSNLAVSPILKFQLAVHEYLGILEVDDSGYRVSSLIQNGGVILSSLTCTFPISFGGQASQRLLGVLTWYTFDNANSGSPDRTEAKFSLQNNGQLTQSSTVMIGMTERNGVIGFNLNWTLLSQQMAFVSFDEFSKAGSFTEPYFADAGFDKVSGLPTYRAEGWLTCKVQKN